MPKWTVQDRYGNKIYLTEERWRHILKSRPELESYFDDFLETIKTGRRTQDLLIPNKYKYNKMVKALLPENNHLIVVVIFKTVPLDEGQFQSSNFVVTGWANFITPK